MDEFGLSDAEFDGVRERIHRLAGLSLSEAKRTMVVARLYRQLRLKKLATFSQYLELLDAPGGEVHVQEFINALTTNLTRFWREEHHFDHLEAAVGKLLKERPRTSPDGRPRLRIWSAGCSTGQEPYSIALTLLAAYPELKLWDFKVLATEIDTAVLTRAERGVYPSSELKGVPPKRAMLLEHGPDGTVLVPQTARDVVSFKALNLIAPWPMRGPFDAVFCRNVTIYFDRQTQSQVFSRLGSVLAPGGFLYIGHSENLGPEPHGLHLVSKTTYQPLPAAAKRNAA